MSLMYIARIKRSTPNFNLNGSEFSFFITALMIAQKMNNDAYYSIKWWSKCTNFSIHTLIQMEKKFMQLSGYSMHITVDDYQIWVRAVRFLAKDHLTMKNQRPSNGQICQPPKRIKTSHPLKRSSSIKISCNDVLPMTLEGIHT
ncbi:hypothetical protein HDV02_003797 [Globomyces sp. JEL0801]|nr:hypothetical protein HDV02_003797 [Globomyces sp. JEL0801]